MKRYLLGMALWTYTLRCTVGRCYVGHTDNLEQRMAQHQSGALERDDIELIRHCEERSDAAIQRCVNRPGLLRSARNDESGQSNVITL